jgi:hypothetical protein
VATPSIGLFPDETSSVPLDAFCARDQVWIRTPTATNVGSALAIALIVPPSSA